MDKHEFKEWLLYHTSIFRSLGTWIAELPPNPPDGMASRSDTTDFWCRILRDASLEDAKAATERLAAGLEPEPRSRDSIPGCVARIARQIARDRAPPQLALTRPIDGEATVRCAQCEDLGMIYCWSAFSMQAVIDGTFGTRRRADGVIVHNQHVYGASVPCTCEAGDPWAKKRRGLRFDPKKWKPVLPYRMDERKEQEAFVEFVDGAYEEWLGTRETAISTESDF